MARGTGTQSRDGKAGFRCCRSVAGATQRGDGQKGSHQAADLKGLKIRTIPTKVFVAALNAMGVFFNDTATTEIYTSLQSGVLDGFEHTAATTISFKLNEVSCCIALTKHLMDPTFLVFSLPEWKKFTPAEQQVLQKGADLGGEVVRAMAVKREAEALATVRKLGMKVNEDRPHALTEAAIPAQNDLAKNLAPKHCWRRCAVSKSVNR